MIIVNLKGGLGNQMFQYACGRALFLRNISAGEKQGLKLDASGYARQNSDTPRAFGLSAFNVTAPLASDEEIRRIKYPFGPASKGWRYFQAKVLRRFNTNFIPSVLGWRGDIYLDGFWQSEKYFKDFEREIRNDFEPKAPLGAAAEKWRAEIAADPSAVSLHVRRGDYASNAAVRAQLGTCDAGYYERAVRKMAETEAKPTLYVFSDDIAWAQENLSFDFPAFFVSSAGIADFEELLLMGACRHNIMANSSFSWWGAWLNRNPGKKIIAPLRWANTHNDDWYGDIIPSSWTRI